MAAAKLGSMTDAANSTADTGAGAANAPEVSASAAIGQMVLMALGFLLLAIDQCRDLFGYLPSPHTLGTTFVGQYRSFISVRDQKELDQAVEAYLDDVEGLAEREIERLKLKAGSADPTDMYPIAPEMAASIAHTIFAKVLEEAAHEHFDKYSNDLMKQEYILTKSSVGGGGAIEVFLGAALVPLAVSKMEDFLGGLVRAGLLLHPKSLGELPNIPNDIFQRYQANISTADIRRWQIDQKVADFIRGSPEDWCESILRWAKIDLTALGADWDVVTELIQRRHAIVHNNSRVDLEYISKVADRLKFGLQLGSPLISNQAYMYPVLVELETWGDMPC